MKKIIFLGLFLYGFMAQAQILTPFQPIQKQPKVQLDYWLYSTNAGNGSSSQYPIIPTSLAEMNSLFNTSNSHSTLIQSGRVNTTKILDWTSVSELTALGINVPNSGNYFALKIEGTFIPIETGVYTFTFVSDDANDLIIEGTTVVSTYSGQPVAALGTRTGTISLIAGRAYSFIARMQQAAGGLGFRLYWRSPIQNATPTSFTSVHPVNTFFPAWTQNVQELMSNPVMDGTTAARAAPSAQFIKNLTNTNTDGVYWINLPIVGPTQIFCLMNSAVNGGGWMMIMKATAGNTFPYSSNYWTSDNTLNPSDNTRNNANAKFNTMNYFAGKDLLALWPDIPPNFGSSTTGGSINLSGTYDHWSWLQNNFNNGIRITPINFFNSASNLFFGDAVNFAGKGTAFPGQTQVRFYGFNYTVNSNVSVRWGFAWNENSVGLYPNGDQTTNDVSGGIGMASQSYSAGAHIGCCNDSPGINRSARVELYIR